MEIGLLLFMVCRRSDQGLVMEHCFHEFLLLCDGDDLELIDQGWGAWLLGGINYKMTREAKHACFSDFSSLNYDCCRKKIDVRSLGRMLELNVYMFCMLAS